MVFATLPTVEFIKKQHNLFDFCLILCYYMFMNIKENLAKNLVTYRKNAGLTQIELAEKLNYSDKAVSKWERGESVPDLCVLKQIADFYKITIDTLISEPKKEAIIPIKNISKKRAIIGLSATGLVWLIAICGFVFINTIFPSIERTWMSFIYAVPITCIVLFTLTCVWGKSLPNMFLLSIFTWSLILSIYLSLLYLLPSPPSKLWEIWLIGIPIQALIVFWFLYKKTK